MGTYFLYENLLDFDTTVITAASENADLPVANIAHARRKKVYRTGVAAAAEKISIDLGSAMAVQAIVLLDHTLTSGDTSIKLQGGATVGATTVDETLTFAAGTIVKILSAAQTYRYWQIIFTKSAAAEYRDIGRVFLGPVSLMAKSFQYGSLEIDPTDLSETERAIGGDTYSDIRDSYDGIKGEFYFVTDAQMLLIEAMCDYVGTHTPLFVSIDSTNMPTRWLYYVKLKKLGKRKAEHLNGSTYYWTVSFEAAEEL